MRTGVSRSCWSAWPDFKRPRARPAPAGSRRVPMAVGEGQVVEEMETSGGRCIYGLSVLFCDCHSVMSSRRQTYEKPPPGLIKEDETKPEDCIPDVPGNEHAREFLAHAPTKGLWMPLGKEVKVMQCWRCKRYGHRTGDKECPFFIKGNQKLEQFRVAHEDPMYDIIRENKRHEKDIRHCGPRPEGVESGKTWRPQESRAFGVTRVNSHLPSSEDVTPGGAVIGWKKWIPTH
ncbi:uncharacterized protein LOC102967435 isoform X4 [Panthera tigris]|uniref:uncharacterized protein LOC102967435 isoform X4 n=1 Tax=Panthera tigris TaxID=9694 RepID=UPI001C6F816A|nr:uncharacterized protein LOC102967435 isoform X4 [Panthera tigris]